MTAQLTQLESIYASRRRKFLRMIKGEAALIPAAPTVTRNRDTDYPFRQDADLLYLTGIVEPSTVLLLLGSSSGPRSILYMRDRDAAQELWGGARLGLSRAKKRFEVDEVKNYNELYRDLSTYFRDIQTLNFPAGLNPEIDTLIWELFRTKQGPQQGFPNTLKDSRLLLSQMRLRKDRREVQLLKHAIDISARAFCDIAPLLKKASSEVHAARLLEAAFAKLGAVDIAFPTIVAAGKHATCLHHEPTTQPLWRRELVLIDAGAAFGGYAADVTRVFPVSGKFNQEQAAVYDAVLQALRTGVRHSRPGATLKSIHKAVATEICKGLIDIGLLRGPLEKCLKSESYKQFFMHSSGHLLGLDVHDITPISLGKSGKKISPATRPLVPGNVFTMEPGIYIAPRNMSAAKAFRGIGIRLEDDILITPSGCEVLSKKLPLERTEIEALMA